MLLRRDPKQRSSRAFTPHNPRVETSGGPGLMSSPQLGQGQGQQFRPFPCSWGSPRAPCTECIPQHTFGTAHIMFDLEWQPEVHCRLFVHILVLAQMFQHIPASLLALTGKKEQNQTRRHLHRQQSLKYTCPTQKLSFQIATSYILPLIFSPFWGSMIFGFETYE